MSFRLQGKEFFLTYSQANFNTDDYIADILLKGHVQRIVLGRELHQDGNEHRHAAIRFETRRDIRNSRFFDFEGFHPKIEKCSSWIKSTRYCKKGGDYDSYPDDTEDEAQFEQGFPECCDFEGERDWLVECSERKIQFGYAARIWSLFSKDRGAITDSESELGDIVPELNWEVRGLKHTIVVTGRSGVGKTSWAIREMPKPALLVTHMDDLRKFDKSFHKGIIFDDMSFVHMPITAQIHLTDSDLDRSIHARYGCATIPKGTLKIFTCNEFPFSEHEAINRRIYKININ